MECEVEIERFGAGGAKEDEVLEQILGVREFGGDVVMTRDQRQPRISNRRPVHSGGEKNDGSDFFFYRARLVVVVFFFGFLFVCCFLFVLFLFKLLGVFYLDIFVSRFVFSFFRFLFPFWTRGPAFLSCTSISFESYQKTKLLQTLRRG